MVTDTPRVGPDPPPVSGSPSDPTRVPVLAMAPACCRPQGAPVELRPTDSSGGHGRSQTASPNIYDLLPIIAGLEPR